MCPTHSVHGEGRGMSQLRALGASALVIGGAFLGVMGLRRRRRPSADDLMRMDDRAFEQHIRSTGMRAQIDAALARIDRGAAS